MPFGICGVVDGGTVSSQGSILTPINRATVAGLVPITLISSETLTGGTLLYYPVSNPNAVTVLNANTGAGQIATLDTTTLNNGSCYILLEATDTSGKAQGSGVYITVAGDYKLGRVPATVTDLVVPAPGLAIQIQRTFSVFFILAMDLLLLRCTPVRLSWKCHLQADAVGIEKFIQSSLFRQVRVGAERFNDL